MTSQRALQEARDFGFSAERICLVPNPLETDLFQPAPEALRSQLRQELGMDTRFTAVCAARLNSEKNHAMLIRAWSLFADGNEDVQLIILGDGPLRDEVRQLASSSAGSASIRMLGPVSDPLRWYQAADVYVLSSDVEGLSNSLLEALSAGLAVIWGIALIIILLARPYIYRVRSASTIRPSSHRWQFIQIIPKDTKIYIGIRFHC